MDNMELNGFHDLNIDTNCEINDELWDTLFDYNFKVIALNQSIDCTEVSRKRKKGEKQEDIVPEPKKIQIPEVYKGKLFVFNRLTVIFSEVAQWYKIVKSKNLKRYHVLAAIPASPNALHHCCSSGEVDIISFKPESRPDWKISRKVYKMAISKNVFFELNYGPVVIDSTCRKNTIQLSQSYKASGKNENLIISSSLTNPFNIRSPYDIIHLCGLFDMSEREAKDAILHNPKNVLKRAAARLQGKAVIKVVNTNKQDTESDEESDLDQNMDVEE